MEISYSASLNKDFSIKKKIGNVQIQGWTKKIIKLAVLKNIITVKTSNKLKPYRTIHFHCIVHDHFTLKKNVLQRYA